MNVVNDPAERAVKLTADFVGAARGEEHFQNILQVVEANHKERPNWIYELYYDYFVFKTLLFVGMVNIELIFIWKKYTVCRFYSNYWTMTWLSGLIEGTIEAW